MFRFMKDQRIKFVIGFIILTIITTSTIFMCFIRKNITVVIDGKSTKLVTYQKTYGSALNKSNINIDIKDKVDKDLNSETVNNGVIIITRAVNLKVFVDNKELNIKSAEKNIDLMLAAQKISLNPADKVSPAKETKLSKGMGVTITRVKSTTINQSKFIAFKTVIKNDNGILKNQRNISQNGVNGVKSITLNIIYENGKEVARKIIKETLVKQPKNKIIVQGTMPTITFSRGDSSADSNKIRNVSTSNTSGRTIAVKATAYSAFGGANNTYTASGQKAVRDPNGYSTIAVDPRVIPLGTRLYVEGYGNAIASDTGSAIKGNYIDLFFNTNQEACGWGVHDVTVHILN